MLEHIFFMIDSRRRHILLQIIKILSENTDPASS